MNATIQEDATQYLGNDLETLEGKVTAAILEKLRAYDHYTSNELSLPIIDYFFLAHHTGGKSHINV